MTNQLAPHQQAILSNLEVLVNLLKDAARISEEGLGIRPARRTKHRCWRPDDD